MTKDEFINALTAETVDIYYSFIYVPAHRDYDTIHQVGNDVLQVVDRRIVGQDKIVAYRCLKYVNIVEYEDLRVAESISVMHRFAPGDIFLSCALATSMYSHFQSSAKGTAYG